MIGRYYFKIIFRTLNAFERRLANSENLITSLNKNLAKEFNKISDLEHNLKELDILKSSANRIDILSMEEQQELEQ